MSLDNNSECVTSKYFVQTAMDESLTDFQETKQNCKGPKTTQKVAKPKARKGAKRIKGQKDIRSALKSKKNELVSYTKEFDTVCKKSGLDVDSEQLQLVIALSKSLQTETSDEASTSQSLSTQGRIAKIRKTLQEYGFKVPETKITAVSKKVKKHRKQYKLLNTTDEERHQKITSRYSQILFECPDRSIHKNNDQEIDAPIYNVATNLSYECMKDNNIFYVNNLVDKSTTNGNLLRDWSEIPGRPVTPELFDRSMMEFSEIICSQDELEIVLSGPIKLAQNILASKQKVKEHIDVPKVIIENHDNGSKVAEVNCEIGNRVNDISIIVDDENKETSTKTPDKQAGKDSKVVELESKIDCTVKEQYRSCSPDIFDDEVSCIMETSKPVLSQNQKTKLFTEETNYMDLTECAYITSQNVIKTSQNLTKRKSNDFMEITNCAVSASQGIKADAKEIDLIQSPEENSVIIVTKNKKNGVLNYIAESPDHSFNDDEIIITGQTSDNHEDGIVDFALTQDTYGLDRPDIIINDIANKMNDIQAKSDLFDENIEMGIEKHKAIKETQLDSNDIDLTQSSNEDTNSRKQETNAVVDNKAESMDLTQSSNSSIDIDDLPEVIIDSQKLNDLDDTIIINPEEYLETNSNNNKVQDDQIFDLTQANESTEQFNKKETAISQSFYDDFVHDHSDSKENLDDIELCHDNNSVHDTSKEASDIDLTQSSDGSIHSSEIVIEEIPTNRSLGKRDEVSIDYDEICEYVSDNENNSKTDKDISNLKHDSSRSEVVESNNLVSNSSQHSEVFDLTDKELDYSLHKSRYEVNYNVDFGGISVVDDNSIAINNVSLAEKINANDSLLPDVYVKKTEDRSKETIDYLEKAGQSSSIIPIVTPKNTEYIFKTNDVTPMLDYASMTTPQRNKELDKYGLKPFKRKRAIQILTHIYNQTHPVIEPYSDDEQPSPSKKPRHFTSPSKQLEPSKSLSLQTRAIPNSKSPKKANEIRNIISLQKIIIPNSKSPKNNNKGTNRNIDSPQKRTILNSISPKKSNGINKSLNSPKKEGNTSKEKVLSTYEISSDAPIIKEADCHPDDWVFQKREKAKVHSCRVPLHIAFHNYVFSRRELREAILKYEPVNIDVIHKDLVSYGHRYDPKDLLRFLDKKCITVKTVDNNARNKR